MELAETTVLNRPFRVLMVAARSFPFLGGIELHIDQVARRLAARGVDVTILTTDPRGELPPRERRQGVAIRRVRAWPARRDYYFAPQIYTEIGRGDWDVVHVQGYQTLVAPVAMLAARRAGIPYVVTFHGGGHSSRIRHAVRPFQLRVLRPLLARAERLVALAAFEIDEYSGRLRLPRERFALIPNGSDLPRDAVSPEIKRNLHLIASVGRLERYKGHHRVIEALPHILEHRPEARLWVAGSGPHETALKQLAEALGVSEQVEIRAIPMAERGQMADELARVKVVVSMSEFETQPIALLEALTLGCRLVVAESPGLSSMAQEGLARSVSLEAPPAVIAAAVLQELDEPGAPRPPRLPTWDQCADTLLDLYRSITRQDHSTAVPPEPPTTGP